MKEELHQCPCCPATKCTMDEPCFGCATYSTWQRNQRYTRIDINAPMDAAANLEREKEEKELEELSAIIEKALKRVRNK